MRAARLALVLAALLASASTLTAQTPVTATPLPAMEVKLRFRDWGPLTLAGTLMLTGNATGRGGIVAVDTVTGRQKWEYLPTVGSSTMQLHAPIVVAGTRALAILDTVGDDAVAAIDVATGKELWRAMIPGGVQNGAGLAVGEGIVAVQTDGGDFVGYEVATGKEAWRTPITGQRSACASVPAVRDGVMYLTGGARDNAAGAMAPADRVFAVDMKTGAVKWRARTDTGTCSEGDVVVADDAVFVSIDGDSLIYAFDRASGQRRWVREVRAMEEGRNRLQPVYGLTLAGQCLVGTMKFGLLALHTRDGATAWQVPGSFGQRLPRAAVAGTVLYFQGSPASAPAPRDKGTLHALDLTTQKVLWSYTHPINTAQNWSFGEPLAVDGAIWITTNGVLLKLQ